MAELVVRDVPKELVQALEERAARHGRTVEQEHRAILRAALRMRRVHLATVLAAMPDVGKDEDFARRQDPCRARVG